MRKSSKNSITLQESLQGQSSIRYPAWRCSAAVRYAALLGNGRDPIGTLGSCVTTSSPKNLSQILTDSSKGDRGALNQLMPLVYDELRRLVRRYLRRERAD